MFVEEKKLAATANYIDNYTSCIVISVGLVFLMTLAKLGIPHGTSLFGLHIVAVT